LTILFALFLIGPLYNKRPLRAAQTQPFSSRTPLKNSHEKRYTVKTQPNKLYFYWGPTARKTGNWTCFWLDLFHWYTRCISAYTWSLRPDW